MSEINFSGEHVAVTGAAGGIGRAFADMFLAEGAKVSISDLSAPECAGQDNLNGYSCDVSDEAQIIKFIDDAEDAFGPVDIFIANAGVGFGDGPGGNSAGGSNESWDKSWAINVMGSVYASRRLIPGWKKRGEGRFVIVSSAAGLLNQIGSASYSATKHAVLGYAEAMAIEHKADGISVHAVCPQYVRTNMTKGMSFAENNKDGLLEPSDVANALKASIEKNEFLVLSHPVVGDYFKAKAMDYDSYISGMARLRAKLSQADVKL
ncbi:MAG: SDR family oxidoreductase [Hellea sp.]|nr:SDR family oxidoreductase [Hellea sp.]